MPTRSKKAEGMKKKKKKKEKATLIKQSRTDNVFASDVNDPKCTNDL